MRKHLFFCRGRVPEAVIQPDGTHDAFTVSGKVFRSDVKTEIVFIRWQP